eukprot:7179216-Pyramimonas_sp.AAC.1
MKKARRERAARAARIQLASLPLHSERELVGPKALADMRGHWEGIPVVGNETGNEAFPKTFDQ